MSELEPSNAGTDCTRFDVIEPHVGIEEIIPVAVAVGAAYQGARTKRKDEATGICRFAMYDRSEETLGRHYFLSGSVGRIATDQWKMQVAILDWDLDPQFKNTNIRELYAFSWLANGNVQAWYSRTRNTTVSSRLSINTTELSRPIEPIDCAILLGIIDGTLSRVPSNNT